MIEVKIFDPPMCCPTGVCGPAPDSRLLEFMETLARLQREYNGKIIVRRGALSQDFNLFLTNQDVMEIVKKQGVDALPLIKINGKIVFQGGYPSYPVFKENIERELKGYEGNRG